MNVIMGNYTSEVCDLLIKAFEKDPMIVFLFSGKQHRLFFRFLINKSQMLNEQMIGERVGEQWVTVANVELPADSKSISWVQQLRFLVGALGLIFKIPVKSFIFINKYMRFTTSVRPKSPHHYLVFMGVDPKMQGQGFGRKTLEYIHCLIDQDPLSTGIGLDTENPENVTFYKKFGYQLVAQKNIQGVTIYSMFRSKSQSN